MEHFIRIAFWIFTLSGSLQAKSLSVMSDFRISLMRDYVECPNSTFYTPENVLDKCITTAVDCVMKELHGTANEECTDREGYINQALDAIDKIRKGGKMDKDHGLTDTDCACEKWRQTSFSEFLNKTNDLLEKINSN
uniref:Interleukin n=1 Tax=Amphiprion ocellaris TaxID=80972 RepID=A0A3Q1CE05_AMPOC